MKAIKPNRADWSRGPPRPLVIPKVMTIATLADVRELMRTCPRITAASRRGSTSLQS
jgi:hypothetical protein